MTKTELKYRRKIGYATYQNCLVEIKNVIKYYGKFHYQYKYIDLKDSSTGRTEKCSRHTMISIYETDPLQIRLYNYRDITIIRVRNSHAGYYINYYDTNNNRYQYPSINTYNFESLELIKTFNNLKEFLDYRAVILL